MSNGEEIPVPLNNDSTSEDAAAWVRQLIEFVGPGFHPDTPFEDYVRDNGARSFTDAECEVLEEGLSTVWEILDNAGIEIYAVGLPVQRCMLMSMPMR